MASRKRVLDDAARMQASWEAGLRLGPSVRRLEGASAETAGETTLTREAEAAYQRWVGQLVGDAETAERYARETPGRRYHQRTYDLPGTAEDYDLRGAYAAGADRDERAIERFAKPSAEQPPGWLEDYMDRAEAPPDKERREPDVPNDDEDWSIRDEDRPVAQRSGPILKLAAQNGRRLGRRRA